MTVRHCKIEVIRFIIVAYSLYVTPVPAQKRILSRNRFIVIYSWFTRSVSFDQRIYEQRIPKIAVLEW